MVNYKKQKLAERIQQEQCPFQPAMSVKAKKGTQNGGFENQFKGAGKVKFDIQNFEKRNQIFMNKKELKRRQQRVREEEGYFVPNQHKKKGKLRPGLHQRLYEEQEKENFRKKRLEQKYRVGIGLFYIECVLIDCNTLIDTSLTTCDR